MFVSLIVKYLSYKYQREYRERYLTSFSNTKQDELYLRLNQANLSSWKTESIEEKKTRKPSSPSSRLWMTLEKVETMHHSSKMILEAHLSP